jgi:hypothetical protein
MPVVNTAIEYLFKKFSVQLINNVTKIPLTTLYRYRSTGVIPSTDYYNKLFNRYRSVMYTQLRASGASKRQADRFKGASPDKVNQIVRGYQETAARLATQYEVDYNTITENMAKSLKDYEEINESP